MEAFFQNAADNIPRADDGGFRQQNVFNLGNQRRNHLIVFRMRIYP